MITPHCISIHDLVGVHQQPNKSARHAHKVTHNERKTLHLLPILYVRWFIQGFTCLWESRQYLRQLLFQFSHLPTPLPIDTSWRHSWRYQMKASEPWYGYICLLLRWDQHSSQDPIPRFVAIWSPKNSHPTPLFSVPLWMNAVDADYKTKLEKEPSGDLSNKTTTSTSMCVFIVSHPHPCQLHVFVICGGDVYPSEKSWCACV